MELTLGGKSINTLKRVWIFGVGNNANILSSVLINKYGTDVCGYVIGDDQKYEYDAFLNRPVIRVSQVCDRDKSLPLLSSVRNRGHRNKIEKELKEADFKLVYSSRNFLEWLAIFELFYRDYFISKGISLNEPTIKWGGMRFLTSLRCMMVTDFRVFRSWAT